MRKLVLAASLVVTAFIAACNADEETTSTPPEKALANAPLPAPSEEGTPRVDENAAREAANAESAAPTGGAGSATDPGTTPTQTPPPTTTTGPDPGPKPAGTCSITKDADGFFVRNSGLGDYVAYVPASYTGTTPMRAIVGMHGCGDTMANFARWGVNPSATRATQDHIGISLGSETGNNKCWSMGNDDAKVLAAVADLSKCFWIHQAKVTIAGFSSGGQLAYRVGMKNAAKLAGILIENSGLYAADSNPDGLLTNAARKISIAHRAHSSDTVFPIAKVKADWTKTTNAGFPLSTSEVAGAHDGTSVDWAQYLIPASAGWSLP
jgi:predicted esterase